MMNVWLDGAKVATVTFRSGKVVAWEYTEEWMRHGFELSPAMDFSMEVKPDAASAYLENLFPEGEAFERLIEALGVSRSNGHAIIRAIGKESTGCLVILDPSETPDSLASAVRLIGREEFERRISKSDHLPVIVWDGQVRLSVAGVQNKLNLIYADGGNIIGLPEGSSSSTHILKFEKGNKEHLVINEQLMLDTARLLDIQTCRSSILTVQGKRLLLVERFDREIEETTMITVQTKIPKAGVIPEIELRALDENYEFGQMDLPRVSRLHLIDSCQALGLPLSYKYERFLGDTTDVRDLRDGVSFDDLGELADICSGPSGTATAILRWALFNLVIGNYDAHGKNISFFMSHNGLTLAPFYDLVSIESIQSGHYVKTFAMAFGDNFGETPITTSDLATFASQLRVSKTDLVCHARDLFERLAGALDQAIGQLPPTSEDEKAFIDHLYAICTDRAKRLLIVIDSFDKEA